MTMRVTTLAKQIAQSSTEIAWPHMHANHVYDYAGTGMFNGDSMKVGEELHKHLELYLNGRFVPQREREVCSVIVEILLELGLDDIETECAVQYGSVRGKVDLYGTHANGRSWVIEVKTTQGSHIEEPRAQELMQLALYARMLQFKNPLLACIRVNLRTMKVGVYLTTKTAPYLDIAEQYLKSA